MTKLNHNTFPLSLNPSLKEWLFVSVKLIQFIDVLHKRLKVHLALLPSREGSRETKAQAADPTSSQRLHRSPQATCSDPAVNLVHKSSHAESESLNCLVSLPLVP